MFKFCKIKTQTNSPENNIKIQISINYHTFPFHYYNIAFIILNQFFKEEEKIYEQYSFINQEKVALRWENRHKKKQETHQTATSINFSFKTHQLSQSQAQIIIPPCYSEFNKPNQIIVIQFGKEQVLAQVPKTKINSKDDRQMEEQKEISLLRTLLDIAKIQCGSSGTLKGHIKILNPTRVPQYNLEYVQLLVKQTYFSRRDQFKVQKALKQSQTHVFIKKALNFDEISVEVISMIKPNQTIVKSGIIDKHTKVIFRTSCSKLTVGIQISVETFQLNEKKQLYLEKMIQFLEVYLYRTQYFKATHRLTLFFYGRCFYPQFKTLQAAYEQLQKQNTYLEENQKFQRNFAVALQKDYKGRIYQDVYRRIMWKSDDIKSFRQFFWERINEFIFTINWNLDKTDHNIASFLKSTLHKKMLGKLNEPEPFDKNQQQKLKTRPFVHKLKCELASSYDSNLFQTLSLVSQQYRHHYQFRTLTETGNTIIILSAGISEYETDITTYKMAKSYVYLTNINVSFINFSNKSDNLIKVNLVVLNQNPIFNKKDAKKLQNLSLHCIEKQIYLSPTKQDLCIIRDDFYNKNCIYPQQIKSTKKDQNVKLKSLHQCQKEKHYELIEEHSNGTKSIKQVKLKNVSFITVYTFQDTFLHSHKKLYPKLQIPQSHLPSIPSNQPEKTQFDIFEANLDKIIVTKQNWNLENNDNEVNKKLNNFREYLQTTKKLKREQKQRSVNTYTQKLSKGIFKISNYVQQNSSNENKFETTSITEGKQPYNTRLRRRKTSETFLSVDNQMDVMGDCSHNGKVNIFEKTYHSKNHQYVAGQKEESKMKKYSSHNKQRLKYQFRQSNVHYIMPNYSESILKKLKAFMKNEYIEELKDEQQNIVFLFQTEKMWKNLIFPLLTPIYTKYKQMFKDEKQYIGSTVTNQTGNKNISILEDEMSKLLMKNFQIQQSQINYNYNNMITKLSKGQVCCRLTMNGAYLTRFYLVDLDKQKRIIPTLFYRYLSYEDKDCRFCSKFIYFKDKNYFPEGKKIQLETKVVKITLCSQESVNQEKIFYLNERKTKNEEQIVKKDHFQDFFKTLTEKYKEMSINIAHITPFTKPNKKKITLDFSKHQKRSIYNHEQLQVDIDIEYNHFSVFQILISWNLCSSVIIKQFVENLMTMGRRNKLTPSLLSSGDIFNIAWSITTIGQIIFDSSVGVSMLQRSVGTSGEWMWDSSQYYIHISGISFIKFVKEKNLILWRDNNHEKRTRDIKKEDSRQQYINFFLKAAAFQFLGQIIEQACIIATRSL